MVLSSRVPPFTHQVTECCWSRMHTLACPTVQFQMLESQRLLIIAQFASMSWNTLRFWEETRHVWTVVPCMIVSQRVSWSIHCCFQGLLLCFFSYSHVFWTSVLLSGYPDTIEDPPQSSGELFARMDRARNEWLGGLADCRHSWVDWLSKKQCFCDSRAVTVGNFRKSENLTRAHSNVCMILDEITRKNLAIIFPFLASLPPVQCDVVFLRLEYDVSCNYLQIASGIRPNILGRTFLKTTHFWKLTIPWLNSQHWFRVTLL